MRIAHVICMLALGLQLISAFSDYLKRSDELSSADKPAESIRLLLQMLPKAGTDQERAEVCWRLSRDIFMGTENLRYQGAPVDALLASYCWSESYADRAISFDPNNPRGYYLKACNIGRREQLHGSLASLAQLEVMRDLLFRVARSNPEASGPWYVLGQLYERVPGWPLSFGNISAAVSLGRKSINAGAEEALKGAPGEVPLDYCVQLARHLMRRGWSRAQRIERQAEERRRFNASEDSVERNFYYEGTVTIPLASDRDEASMLCNTVIRNLERIAVLCPSQAVDLGNARDILAEIGRYREQGLSR